MCIVNSSCTACTACTACFVYLKAERSYFPSLEMNCKPDSLRLVAQPAPSWTIALGLADHEFGLFCEVCSTPARSWVLSGIQQFACDYQRWNVPVHLQFRQNCIYIPYYTAFLTCLFHHFYGWMNNSGRLYLLSLSSG